MLRRDGRIQPPDAPRQQRLALALSTRFVHFIVTALAEGREVLRRREDPVEERARRLALDLRGPLVDLRGKVPPPFVEAREPELRLLLLHPVSWLSASGRVEASEE